MKTANLGVFLEEDKRKANAKNSNPRNFMKSGASENQFTSLTLNPQHSTCTQRILFSVYKLKFHLTVRQRLLFQRSYGIALSPLHLTHRFPTNIPLPNYYIGCTRLELLWQGRLRKLRPQLTSSSKLGLFEPTLLPVRKHYSSNCNC